MANLTVTFTADQLKRLRAEAFLDGTTNVAHWVRDRALEAASDRGEERRMLEEIRIRNNLPRAPIPLPTTFESGAP